MAIPLKKQIGYCVYMRKLKFAIGVKKRSEE